MAYIKQTWEDRVVEKPMTYTITNNEDGTVTLTPVPGTITNEGSKVNAERMNHIEQGIYDAAISGGSDVVFIGDTEPTNEQTKLWVEDDMLNSLGTEIESGSNDKGSYIKFADGTMICHARKTITAIIDYAWGNLYTSASQVPLTYPIEFIGTPRLSFEIESNLTVWKMFDGIGNNKTTPRYYIVSGVTRELGSFDIEYIAIGRWKA